MRENTVYRSAQTDTRVTICNSSYRPTADDTMRTSMFAFTAQYYTESMHEKTNYFKYLFIINIFYYESFLKASTFSRRYASNHERIAN